MKEDIFLMKEDIFRREEKIQINGGMAVSV